MSYFVGIDLHSDNSYVGVIDKKDSRIFGKKLPNDLVVILKTLEPFQKKIQGIVVESTYNWYWLVDGLQAAKYQVHLANPAQMQQYSGMKYTDDTWDSYWLAHLLRLGILPEGYIYPKEIRPIRDLLRKRTMLVRHRTAHLLSLQNMVNRNTGRKVNVNDAKRLSEEKLRGAFPNFCKLFNNTKIMVKFFVFNSFLVISFVFIYNFIVGAVIFGASDLEYVISVFDIPPSS